MAYVNRARDLPGGATTGMSIRLAKRESFDAKKAIQPPSATGGAPTMNTQQLPAMRGPATPTPADQYRMQTRRARPEQPILPFLLSSRRSIEDYNDMAPGFSEQLARDFVDEGVAADIMDANELAKRTAAFIMRSADPTSTSVDLPTTLYQNTNARRVLRFLEQLRARRRAG